MPAQPIFPGSHPPSIVGTNGLNYCVRDGNRWDPAVICTGYSSVRERGNKGREGEKMTRTGIEPMFAA